jgi:hypothetical protein
VLMPDVRHLIAECPRRNALGQLVSKYRYKSSNFTMSFFDSVVGLRLYFEQIGVCNILGKLCDVGGVSVEQVRAKEWFRRGT